MYSIIQHTKHAQNLIIIICYPLIYFDVIFYNMIKPQYNHPWFHPYWFIVFFQNLTAKNPGFVVISQAMKSELTKDTKIWIAYSVKICTLPLLVTGSCKTMISKYERTLQDLLQTSQNSRYQLKQSLINRIMPKRDKIRCILQDPFDCENVEMNQIALLARYQSCHSGKVTTAVIGNDVLF